MALRGASQPAGDNENDRDPAIFSTDRPMGIFKEHSSPFRRNEKEAHLPGAKQSSELLPTFVLGPTPHKGLISSAKSEGRDLAEPSIAIDTNSTNCSYFSRVTAWEDEESTLAPTYRICQK